MTQTIQILIADDHPIVRTGLATMIRYESDMEMVAEASNGQEAVDLFQQYQPDVALIDLRMPGLNGVEAIIEIRAATPNARLIILSTYDGDENIYQGLQAGAKAYLLKDAPCEQLLAAIRQVSAGGTHIPPEVGIQLADGYKAGC